MMANKYKIIFFAENSGKEPVREWLKKLDLDEQRKIGKLSQILQERWPIITEPHVKPLGRGIFELRINLKNRIARIIFVVQDMEIVFLNGFIKKTQKTPINEIAVSLDRLKKHIKGIK